MSLTGSIANIARMSLHDGPGVRTVIYFKGCTLRCRWCHNPETLSERRQVLYAPVKCIHCGRCVSVCAQHHRIEGHDMIFEREGCTACGRCAAACPSGALSLCGEAMTLDEVMAEVRKDIHFFKATGGGVTLSGGECLLQADFAEELLSHCRSEGIHTAIESAFYVPWKRAAQVIPHADLCFADLKIADPEKHRLYTGQDNRLILENLRRLTREKEQVVIRIPLIPGVNDSSEDMRAFADVIRTLGAGVQSVELLRYNNLAESKYRMAGMDYEDFGAVQEEKQVEALCANLKEHIGAACEVFYKKS